LNQSLYYLKSRNTTRNSKRRRSAQKSLRYDKKYDTWTLRCKCATIALNLPATRFTAFFILYQNDTFAKTLLYLEVPAYYTWNESKKSFERSKKGEPVDGQPGTFKKTTIGRLYAVS
uniref:Ovule protein n=1 Tax=Onchocerca flexuosa TaxID=387005 RepID=A0A183HJW2_9BILA